MANFIIDFLALGTLFSSILSITFKNSVISVIFLILTFVQAAGYLIFIGINFIGISYIIIYVGAIAVLFLFVIMMINLNLSEILETGNEYTKNLPLAIIISSLFMFIFGAPYILPYKSIILPNLWDIFYIINNQIMSFSYKIFSLFGIVSESVTNTSLLNIEVVDRVAADSVLTSLLQIESLGHMLYTHGAILLIILSIILLLGMYASIIITSKNH